MNDILATFFNLEVARKIFGYLVEGLGTTIALSALTIPLGLAGGLLLALLHTQTHSRAVRLLVIFYVDFFRSFPQLVLLIFVSFATPFLGLNLPPILSLAISFTLSTSAYYSEIFRSGIQGIPAGQAEAARSTGMGRFQTLRHVVLPQAARNVTPDLIGNSVEVVKGTSIASVLGMHELLHNAHSAQSVMFNPTPLTLAALLYLLLLWPIVRFIRRLESAREATR